MIRLSPIALSRLLLLTLIPTLVWAGEGGYTVTTVGGAVYGPGPMPATPITDGVFTHVKVGRDFSGTLDYFNNGIAEPNIPGEKEIYGAFRGGLLSNGVPFNEHLHGGVLNIGQGALRMLAVVASDGPNKGGEKYWVDDRLNWRFNTDMALDAGFPQALTVTYNIQITSGVLWVPQSLQSEQGQGIGMDFVDSIPSGAPTVGRFGDRDNDGFMDAEVWGSGRVPLRFLFVPGAPLVMSRTVTSDIPITPRVAGILELSGIANLGVILDPPQGQAEPDSPIERYYQRMLPRWAEQFAERAAHAADQLAQAKAPEAALARQVAEALSAALAKSAERSAYREAIAAPLAKLNEALPSLRAAFDRETQP